MNSWQKRILITLAVFVAVTLVYPPFHFIGPGGAKRNFGYSWIFAPPNTLASVDVGLLLAQWLGLGIIAAIAYVLSGSVRNAAQSVRPTGVTPDVPTVHGRVSKPAVPSHPTPSVTRHVIRWAVLVACFVLAVALFALSGVILKDMGLGGFVSGAIRSALWIWFLFWVWGATKRIVGADPKKEP